MPELPEVETVVRGLQDPLTSQRIEEVQVDDERLLRNASPEEFKSEVIHQPISKVERLGKYIVFHLTENLLFAIHLRMTGRLLLCGNEDANTDYRRLQLGLTRHQLVMDDMRRFGTLDLLHSVNEDPLGGIGLEPLGESYTWERFRNLFRNSGREIKRLLLDQSVVAGIGNIYASEILHRAQVSPWTRAEELEEDKLQDLYQAIPNTLSEAIQKGGSTIDTFKNSQGTSGDFQLQLKVYDSEDQPCPECGTAIQKAKQGGRSTFFCPSCQAREFNKGP